MELLNVASELIESADGSNRGKLELCDIPDEGSDFGVQSPKLLLGVGASLGEFDGGGA